MAIVLEFKMTNRTRLRRIYKEAEEEFKKLYFLTGGQPGLAPPYLLKMDMETYKSWENGEFEL